MAYQETSREAWVGFVPTPSAKLDDLICQALLHAGPSTCQAIEEGIGRDHQSVSGNLRHLVENDLVQASGQFGKTRSGRRAIKWEMCKWEVA